MTVLNNARAGTEIWSRPPVRRSVPRRPAGRGPALRFLFLLSLMAAGWMPGDARGEGASEYEVKAAFLFHFAQFVEWPTNEPARTNDPLVIGVLGSNPFGSFLDEAVRGKTVGGRKVTVKRCWRASQAKSCQIVFISRSERRWLTQVLDELKGKPLLTVSDIDGCAARGVAIGFVTVRDRIELQINPVAVKGAGLSVSSKLLRVADIVPPQKKP